MFNKIATAETLVVINNGIATKVEIEKYRKSGTKREFFTPSIGGRRMTSTMFARLYDAERFAKQAIKSK